jgi:hypothetical protein
MAALFATFKLPLAAKSIFVERALPTSKATLAKRLKKLFISSSRALPNLKYNMPKIFRSN